MNSPVKGMVTPALVSIIDERVRQEEKWGIQRLSWTEWIATLMEEVGEAACAANTVHWAIRRESYGATAFPLEPLLGKLREELVHTAAVAVQMIEQIDEMCEGST